MYIFYCVSCDFHESYLTEGDIVFVLFDLPWNKDDVLNCKKDNLQYLQKKDQIFIKNKKPKLSFIHNNNVQI